MTIDKDKAVEAQRRAHIKNGYNVDDELLTADQLRELFAERDTVNKAAADATADLYRALTIKHQAEAERDRYKADAERYNKLRKLNVLEFKGLFEMNIRGLGLFDDLVDLLP